MISDKHITEIAEWLDCGMVCYFHKPTASIEYYPDPYDGFFDEELWQEVIEKVENDCGNYEKFEKMDSNQGFRVMEDFAYSLKDEEFKNQLISRLSNRKPFQNFKILVESSKYREDWFAFKKEANIDWVREQIKFS